MNTRLFLSFLSIALASGCDAYLAGHNGYGQLGIGDDFAATSGSPDVGVPWVRMEAGFGHTCGITLESTLWCWGYHRYGQVGHNGPMGSGSEFFQTTPAQVGTATDWQFVSPGAFHTCGIRAGEMWCWGRDSSGQLGNGSTTTDNQPAPVQVGTATDWTFVESGRNHTCGLRGTSGTGDLYCWGNNTYGQLGNQSFVDATTPQLVAGTFGPWKTVSGGRRHTCAINHTDNLYCWGSNKDGALGDSAYTLDTNWNAPLYPVQNSWGGKWESVSAGSYFSCALSLPPHTTTVLTYSNPVLWCWGNNVYKKVDPLAGDESPVISPTTYPADFFFCSESPVELCGRLYYHRRVAAGHNHVCAIRSGYVLVAISSSLPPIEVTDKRIDCQGNNVDNQLAIEGAQPSPGVVADPIFVSAGFRHSVALWYVE